MSKTALFGYLSPVHDESSARYAIKMAGLPALFMAANAAILAMSVAVHPTPYLPVIVSATILAMCLLLMSLRMRAGHAGWVPFVLLLFSAFIALKLFLIYLELRIMKYTGTKLEIVLHLAGLIVPIICAIFILGGLRGWRWLRAHNAKISF